MLAVGAALVAATWAHALLGFGGTAADELFARWIYDAIILSAAFTLLWRAWTRPAGRIPWLFLGIGVAAFVDDPHRFPDAKAVGSSFGLVPCQDQSGDRNRLGHITRAGAPVVRQLPAEDAPHGRNATPS